MEIQTLCRKVLAQIEARRKKIADRKEREAARRFAQMCADAGGGNEELGRELLEKDGVYCC